MDVSFSAWSHAREETLVLKGDSFSFLFDRRYTNRLNRMSRVFFEAYVRATKELAAQEDRFPSLSEIDSKMESGAVYAFKDRLMKNTEFFEEVKISGVSYLVPRALRFIDASGTYTDLVLNFEEGSVTLPTRRKTPAPVEVDFGPATDEDLGPAEEAPETKELEDTAQAPSIEPTPEEVPEAKAEEPAPTAEEDIPQAFPGHIAEPYLEQEEPVVPEEKAPPVATPAPPPPEIPKAHRPPMPTEELRKGDDQRMKMIVAALVVAAMLLTAGVTFFLSQPPAGTSSTVKYSAYLSNSSNESYLGMEISNPEGMTNEVEMLLPKDIDRSISARGGVVSISHADKTIVRLNSSDDASVKIYLIGNWTYVPVTLNLAVPEEFDSGVVVLGKDYLVTRKDDTLVLQFNLTEEGVNFEQSYTPRR
jgi:hypothetical protein